MSEAKEQLEKAKNVRRAAKGKLTRVIRTAKVLLGAERPVQEIEDILNEIKDSYAALIVKHEEYGPIRYVFE